MHWKQLRMEFDAIYSGFLGNKKQVQSVLSAISSFGGSGVPIIVDPVLADNGKLYSCYDPEMVAAMRVLVGKADIITPNYTEACLLSDVIYKDKIQSDEALVLCEALAEMGAKHIIITSVPDSEGNCSQIVYYEARTSRSKVFAYQYQPYYYPGTGDIFCSMIVAKILNGKSIEEAIPCAAEFISRAILHSSKSGRPYAEGLLLEQCLWEAVKDRNE